MADAKSAPKKSISKVELLTELATATGLTKKQVASVFDELTTLISKQLGKKGPGVIALPGLLKIQVVRKPARPAKKGVKNPFRPGEIMDVPAKPASNVVKVRPLKALKAMV